MIAKNGSSKISLSEGDVKEAVSMFLHGKSLNTYDLSNLVIHRKGGKYVLSVDVAAKSKK